MVLEHIRQLFRSKQKECGLISEKMKKYIKFGDKYPKDITLFIINMKNFYKIIKGKRDQNLSLKMGTKM